MKENFIDRAAIQNESEKLKKLNSVKKRKRKDPWLDLRPLSGEIMYMAVDCRFSKRHIANILQSRYGLSISHNRIFNFVRSQHNGKWPNARKKVGAK